MSTLKEYWGSGDFFGEGALPYIHAYMHANYSYHMHSHQFYEINIIMKGKGRHHIEYMSMPAVVGDVFVIPPGMKHCYTSEERIDVFHILLSNCFLEKYRIELEELPGYKVLFDIEPYIRSSGGKHYNLRLSYGRLDELKRELDLIVGAEADELYSFESILTLSLMAKFCIQFYGRISSFEGRDGVNFEIMKIMDYISNNLDAKLTLDDMSSYAGMSKATLNRLFRSVLKTTPGAYILRCRTERARSILKNNKDISKSEVAQMCGFYDSSHMNKNIKQ